MPHAWIEYSSNLAQREEIKTLGRCVYDAIVEAGIFPIAGIRVRVNRIDDYLVGDCKPDRGFVHLSMRIGEGRDLSAVQQASDIIFQRVSRHLFDLSEEQPVAFAFELQEIPGAFSYKMNSLRKFIQDK